MLRYKYPEHKDLYIVNNDPKKVALYYKTNSSPFIEYYYIDWNNPNTDEPFISDMKGKSVFNIDLFFMKLFKKIRKPTIKEKNMIDGYGFWEMLKVFDEERINMGMYIVDKDS